MIQDIAEILGAGDPEKFVGLREDLYLEAKSAPGDLVADAGARYELAKDVSALANAQGGYLIIGLRTERDPSSEEDVIKEITPIESADFTIARYEGVIGTHVHPNIKGLAVSWLPFGGGTKGLGLIFVPQQDLDRKPFLVAKVVADGASLKEIVVGYAERFEAGNEPLTRERLQEQLKKGRDSSSQRLTRIEEALDEIRAGMSSIEKRPSPSSPEAEGAASTEVAVGSGGASSRFRYILDHRIEAAASEAPRDQPYYILAASMLGDSRVLRFRTEGSESAKQTLFDAGRLREGGFDLTIGALPEPGPEGSWEARQGDRKVLRLYQDGTVIFGAAADHTFLGWGQEKRAFQSHPRVNPVAAVEIHASFAAFISHLLPRLEHPPLEILFRLSLRNPKIGKEYLYLTDYLREQHFIVDLKKHPIEREPADEKLVSTADEIAQHPMRVAAQLAHRFYSMFDFAASVPFVTIDAQGQPAVDMGKLTQR